MNIRFSDGVSKDTVLVLPFYPTQEQIIDLLGDEIKMREFAELCYAINNLGGGVTSTRLE
jgi:hypothetical protein